MLKGLICPDGSRANWEKCLSCNNPACYPLPIRKLIHKYNAEQHKWVSVTGLLYCLRKTKFEHDLDYYDKQDNLFPLVRGSLVHEMLSNINDGLVEYPLEKDVPELNMKLYGTLDHYSNGILEDYKTMSHDGLIMLSKKGLKPEYIWQVNIYKWMLQKPVNEIRLIFISMKDVAISGQKFRTWYRGKEREYDIPAVPIYSDEKIEAFLYDKLKMLSLDAPPPANPDNKWLCDRCPFREKCKSIISKPNISIRRIS